MELAIGEVVKPELDAGFVPAVLWNRAYRRKVAESGGGRRLILALERGNGAVSTHETEVLADNELDRPLNFRYVERLVKNLLWMRGGHRVVVAGDDAIASHIAAVYAADGERFFDADIMGARIYGRPMEVVAARLEDAPASREMGMKLGGNLDGCRIGFDLGGSDRKCAAVIDGEVVFTEEVGWDPYFQKDPSYHLDGIRDTLCRAAAKLPRVDAIGGSSAGVYVDNKVRIASLFRGVPRDKFDKMVVNMFTDLVRDEWNDVPFALINDGEVTALAGAMGMGDNAVLGLSMGTSQAVGYVTPEGSLTDWLNEFAFVPVDYRLDAPVDEWSGDRGCGVQYFSQQAVARLAPAAGIEFADSLAFPERLIEVQRLMADGDARAAAIYRTIGVYFAYAVAHYADFYDIRNLLVLGRVTSGAGGDLVIATAEATMAKAFPELAGKIKFRTPDEQGKRHGQAVAAASLPSIKK